MIKLSNADSSYDLFDSIFRILDFNATNMGSFLAQPAHVPDYSASHQYSKFVSPPSL